jgi:capsid protein
VNLLARTLDSAIATAFPGWALHRAEARHRLTELGRWAANPEGAWKPATLAEVASSESQKQRRERVQMLAEARDIVANFGFVKSLFWKFGNYVTGQLNYQAGTDDEDVNAWYEDYIREWMEVCDLTGRFPFRKLVEMAYLGAKIDGDSGIILVDHEDDLRLQLIQADRIGNPYDLGSIRPRYFSGITVDEVGRPQLARIYARRENQYSNPIEVPWENFVHVINPLHSDEYRGRTTLDTAIPVARNIFEILKAEQRAVKTLSRQTAIVSSKGNHLGERWRQAEQQAAAEGGKRPPNEEIVDGQINYVANGDTITAFTHSRPTPTFNGFLQTLFREICHGTNVGFGFFYDPSGLGGATARLDSKQTQRTFSADKQWVLEQIFRPIIRRKLSLGIAKGEIPAHPQFRRVNCLFPEHASMDEGRDSDKDIEELKMGIKTLSEVIGDKDIDEHLDRVAREQAKIIAVAEKYHVPVTSIQQRTPNANETAADDPPSIDRKAAKAPSSTRHELSVPLPWLHRTHTVRSPQAHRGFTVRKKIIDLLAA